MIASDCTQRNFVQDPTQLLPAGYHPVLTWQDPTAYHLAKYITRTECWPRYFIIDFGLSMRYDPANGPPSELAVRGGDKSAPEHYGRHPSMPNPFPTDIYYLGNMLKEDFLYSRKHSKRILVRFAVTGSISTLFMLYRVRYASSRPS